VQPNYFIVRRHHRDLRLILFRERGTGHQETRVLRDFSALRARLRHVVKRSLNSGQIKADWFVAPPWLLSLQYFISWVQTAISTTSGGAAVLWLLEETLGVPYEVKRYERGCQDMLPRQL